MVRIAHIIRAYLAQVSVLELEKTLLQVPTRRGVNLIAQSRHALGKCLHSSRSRWGMRTEESLLRKRCRDFLCNERVGLVAELLNQLMCRSRNKDVVFNRDILIIQLVDQTQRRNILGTCAIASLTELECDILLTLEVQ